MTSETPPSLSPRPPLGWNSFDCYGSHINAELLGANLEAFIQKLKPAGYEYFVIDAGWYRHYDLREGEQWPSDNDKAHCHIDNFGRFLPSEILFPNGLKPFIDRAHECGLKFGLHLMRGIPREVVERNLPIKGTAFHARDIANTEDICTWSKLCYGIKMEHPAAQAYYDSVLELVASWGVDFIKYDDIVHKPAEINAVADALAKTGRPIVLSLSPGDDFSKDNRETFRRAQLVRITRDIWDLREDIKISFDRWEKFRDYAGESFWPDLDMIPLGRIKLHAPMSRARPFAPRGYARHDNFSYAQKKTFMTQRAMAASPLFMGGDLVSSPGIVFELLTDPEMLACNQNGVVGFLHKRIETYATFLDVWRTPSREEDGSGWIGLFNRQEYKTLGHFEKADLGLEAGTRYTLYDIWGKRTLEDSEEFFFEIEGDDVLFLRYQAI